MVFKARSVDGEIDPNINTRGRPKETHTVSRREQKEKELLALARKLKPHLAAAVEAVSGIMRSDKATDGNKLKASALFMAEYRKLMLDVYEGEGEDGDESTPEAVNPSPSEKPPAVVLALQMQPEDK